LSWELKYVFRYTYLINGEFMAAAFLSKICLRFHQTKQI
jgi:hypothetical protein